MGVNVGPPQIGWTYLSCLGPLPVEHHFRYLRPELDRELKSVGVRLLLPAREEDLRSVVYFA